MTARCPHCKKPIVLNKGPSNGPQPGILSKLKPYLEAETPFITLDNSVDPILIPTTRYDNKLWQEVMAIVREYGGTWNKARRRWEVPA